MIRLVAFVAIMVALILLASDSLACLAVFAIISGAGLILLGWEIAHSRLVDEFGREIEED